MAADFLEDWITEHEYAKRRDVSVRTCQRDRRLRNAPRHVKFGNKIYYHVPSIKKRLEEQAVEPLER